MSCHQFILTSRPFMVDTCGHRRHISIGGGHIQTKCSFYVRQTFSIGWCLFTCRLYRVSGDRDFKRPSGSLVIRGPTSDEGAFRQKHAKTKELGPVGGDVRRTPGSANDYNIGEKTLVLYC